MRVCLCVPKRVREEVVYAAEGARHVFCLISPRFEQGCESAQGCAQRRAGSRGPPTREDTSMSSSARQTGREDKYFIKRRTWLVGARRIASRSLALQHPIAPSCCALRSRHRQSTTTSPNLSQVCAQTDTGQLHATAHATLSARHFLRLAGFERVVRHDVLIYNDLGLVAVETDKN